MKENAIEKLDINKSNDIREIIRRNDLRTKSVKMIPSGKKFTEFC